MANLDSNNRVSEIGSGYRTRAWLAVVLLLAFLALYLLLACWFSWTTYRMFSGVFGGGNGAAAGFFSAIPALFLAIFMWKALLFVRVGGGAEQRVEITAEQQPRLFQFIHELADELGAPKPHKVFLGPVVNASVFYDLSILNFLLPSRKNLMIGLGLINALNRSEFRAVLAHEFGHFAQKTMSVGRWIYVGSQIAEHIVAKRDWLDRGLDWLSTFDLRFAWIGWIMRTIVWSIRSLTETVFGFVVMAQRALSREMEFEADLVAVSATGSDALIHALYKLQVADEDWNQTLTFADEMLQKDKLIPDPFLIHTAITEHLRTVLHQPDRGLTPAIPTFNAGEHRIFTEKLAQPPRMWATHPPNNEREENAKRNYVAVTLDASPAWELFDNASGLKENVTATLTAGIVEERKEAISRISKGESLEALDRLYSRAHFDPSFQGTYRDRFVMTAFESANEAVGELPPRDQIADELRGLYPDSLREKLEYWRNLSEDVVLLELIENGVMDAPTGMVRHRGQDYKLSALSTLIQDVSADRDAALASVDIDDRRCRAAHNAAARYVARGWQDYHGSLVKMLHYAEHSLAELADVQRFGTNLFHMSVAAGRPSERQIKKIMTAMNELHSAMKRLHADAKNLKVSPPLLEKLEVKSWPDALEPFELPPANRENIQQWLNVIDSWYGELHDRYRKLREHALDDLLAAEAQISEYYFSSEEPEVAPERVVAPEKYVTRVRGTEREIQKRLDWWSRFTLADGLGPTIMRFGVAASIVGGVIWLGTIAGNATVIVCNGLSIPVNVQLDNTEITIRPQTHKSFSAGTSRSGLIRTTNEGGKLIEEFEVDLSLSYATYVYNVAGAAAMTEWEVGYGNARPDPPLDLGAPRWRTTAVSHVFENPPKTVSTKGGGATRTVLTHHSKMHPQQMLDLVSDKAESENTIRMHAIWGSGNSRWIDQWLGLAAQQDDFKQIIEKRLVNHPDDFMASFMMGNLLEDDEKVTYQKQIRQRAKDEPDNSELQFLVINFEESSADRDAKYHAGAKKFPESQWFQYSSAMVDVRNLKWKKAEQVLSQVVRSPGPWFTEASKTCARIRRLLNGNDSYLSGLQESVELRMYAAIENADVKTDFEGYVAYKLIDQGRLVDAQKRANETSFELVATILLAASEGATKDMQERGLALPMEEVSQHGKLYLAALSAKIGKPYEKYLDSYLENESTTRNSAADSLRMILKAESGNFPEEALKGLNPDERGYVMAAAATFAADRVSSQWKHDAKRLLFCVERPWFELN